MESNTFNILKLDKNGCYTILIPNFELMRFDETNQVVKANEFTSFGFSFEHNYNEEFTPLLNKGKEEKKKVIFRKSYEKLQQIINSHGAHYVLVDGLDIHASAASWHVNIKQCQMLIKINHPHVPPTVYRS